jgi:hypothetical protein
MTNHPHRSRRVRKPAAELALEYEAKAAARRAKASEWREAGNIVRAELNDRIAVKHELAARNYAVSALSRASRRIPS